LVKGIQDVIMRAKFGDDRLRGSGVVAGQISAYPIDFAGRPYNTLTLPCERVIRATTQTCDKWLKYFDKDYIPQHGTRSTLQAPLLI